MPLLNFTKLGPLSDSQNLCWRHVANAWADHLDGYIRHHRAHDPFPFAYGEQALVSQLAVGVARAAQDNAVMCEFGTGEGNNRADAWFVVGGEFYLLEAKRLELGQNSNKGWLDDVPDALHAAFVQAGRYKQGPDWLAACVFLIPRIPARRNERAAEVMAGVVDTPVGLGGGVRGFRADYVISREHVQRVEAVERFAGATMIVAFRQP